jgi:hypothetical protein
VLTREETPFKKRKTTTTSAKPDTPLQYTRLI